MIRALFLILSLTSLSSFSNEITEENFDKRVNQVLNQELKNNTKDSKGLDDALAQLIDEARSLGFKRIMNKLITTRNYVGKVNSCKDLPGFDEALKRPFTSQTIRSIYSQSQGCFAKGSFDKEANFFEELDKGVSALAFTNEQVDKIQNEILRKQKFHEELTYENLKNQFKAKWIAKRKFDLDKKYKIDCRGDSKNIPISKQSDFISFCEEMKPKIMETVKPLSRGTIGNTYNAIKVDLENSSKYVALKASENDKKRNEEANYMARETEAKLGALNSAPMNLSNSEREQWKKKHRAEVQNAIKAEKLLRSIPPEVMAMKDPLYMREFVFARSCQENMLMNDHVLGSVLDFDDDIRDVRSDLISGNTPSYKEFSNDNTSFDFRAVLSIVKFNEKNDKVIKKLNEISGNNKKSNEIISKLREGWEKRKANLAKRKRKTGTVDIHKIALLGELKKQMEEQDKAFATSLLLNPISFSKKLLDSEGTKIDVCKVMLEASALEKEKSEVVELADYALLGLGVLAAVPTLGSSLAMTSAVLAIKLGSDYSKIIEAEEKRDLANVVNAGQSNQSEYYSDTVQEAHQQVVKAQSDLIQKVVDAYVVPKIPFLSKLNIEGHVKNGLKSVLGKAFTYLETRNKLSIIINTADLSKSPAVEKAMEYAVHVAAKPPNVRIRLQGKVDQLFELAAKSPTIVDKAFNEAINQVKAIEKKEVNVWKYLANPSSDGIKGIIDSGVMPDMRKVGDDLVEKYKETEEGQRTLRHAKKRCTFN